MVTSHSLSVNKPLHLNCLIFHKRSGQREVFADTSAEKLHYSFDCALYMTDGTSPFRSFYSSFSQIHKVGIVANFVFPYTYLQCSSLFSPTDESMSKVRNQGIGGGFFSRLQTSLVQLILNRRVTTKLAILAFLYCGEFVKNSNGWPLGLKGLQNLVACPRAL